MYSLLFFFFLLTGQPIARYAPSTSAAAIEKDLTPLLNLPDAEKATEGASAKTEVTAEN